MLVFLTKIFIGPQRTQYHITDDRIGCIMVDGVLSEGNERRSSQHVDSLNVHRLDLFQTGNCVLYSSVVRKIAQELVCDVFSPSKSLNNSLFGGEHNGLSDLNVEQKWYSEITMISRVVVTCQLDL